MIKIKDVEKSYQSAHVFKRRRTPIVKGVSFECPIGATIAIIGESGSGKSTLSRMILGIEKPDKGCVTLNDQPMHKKKVRRHQIGAVFQDYTSSLHPFQTVREILFEVMCQCDGQPKDVMEVQAITLLEEVGLSKAYMDKYPNMKFKQLHCWKKSVYLRHTWINILICYQVERRNVLRLRVQYVLTLNIFCLMKPLVHSTCQFKHKY